MSENITNNPSVPTQIVSEVKFPRFINNLGIIPTSYKDSMSYYETLAWLCKYLEETVIPTVNQNGGAVQELQALYIQLNDYVSHYFDNLDVQEEINNKLDAMVLDGTLAEIINEELFNELDSRIDSLSSAITNLTTQRYILIGDSYVTGTLNGEQYATDGWADRFKTNLGLSSENCYIYGDGGAGFIQTGHNGYNFVTLLSSNLDNITNKNTIDKIVVCGGYNDMNKTVANIETAINSLMTIVNNNFPNAKVYIGCISTTSEMSDNGTTVRKNINHTSLVAYKNCVRYGAYYLNGVESILKDYQLMGTDYFHPSVQGYNELAYGIAQCLETGYYSRITGIVTNAISVTDGSFSGSCSAKITNSNLLLIIEGNIIFDTAKSINTSTDIALGVINNRYVRKNFNGDLRLAGISLSVDGVNVEGYAYLDNLNQIMVRFKVLPTGVTTGTSFGLRSFNYYDIND